MKKTVKVKDIIRIAKNWASSCKESNEKNNIESAIYYREKVNTCLSLLMILAYNEDIDNFDKKWDEIHKEIWGD